MRLTGRILLLTRCLCGVDFDWLCVVDFDCLCFVVFVFVFHCCCFDWLSGIAVFDWSYGVVVFDWSCGGVFAIGCMCCWF